MAAIALATALLLGAAPAHASEKTEPSTVAESVALDPKKEIKVSTPNYWEDAEAKPGDIIRIPYRGNHTYSDLKVEAAEPFQDFSTLIELDNSIVIAVPKTLTGVASVAPVFTVSDKFGEIDTFSITVQVNPLTQTEQEHRSALFDVISQIANRMPHLPFVAELLKY
ncbi:hypothetical protein ccrud_10120 [Corynebacterium crudilactis]|uniref:Uncharacterized protein n=2 Tax=Corynebacterium crudilactis TaxID=1652495 RepID=A0A172QV51_9CORY|nr:hypothetical protein ccrud_10120 [Corynebacterium crudilactis]